MTKKFIKSIIEVKQCGVFQSWPKGNLPFGRYNLIFGWNGSGKTTLSRIFRSLEKGDVEYALIKDGNKPQFQFQLWDDSTISSKDLSGWHDKIRVFNCDFVRDSINTDDAEAEPVYHLGKEQGDALKEIAQIKEQIDRISVEYTDKNTRLSRENKLLSDAISETAKKIKDVIAMSAYNAAKLRPHLEQLTANNADVKPYILDDKDLQALRSVSLGINDKDKHHALTISSKLDAATIHNRVASICSQSVTKRVIEELDNSVQLREWVRQGLELHSGIDTCAFCNAKINDGRLDVLNQYFNKAYTQLTGDILSAKTQLSELINEIRAIVPIEHSRIYPNVVAEYIAACESLELTRAQLIVAIQDLMTSLDTKRESLTTAMSVSSIDGLTSSVENYKEATAQLNSVVQQHNALFDNFEQMKEQAHTKIINHYSAQFYDPYIASITLIKSLEDEVAPLSESLHELKSRLTELDNQLSEHDTALSRINELLASFIGRSDIELTTNSKGYYIQRNGERATFLSEGEKTAIAFVYFIAKLEEKEFAVENSVIIIDDPISSLDTNALYAACSFIRCHLESANQLFVLTHNYHFFREIFGWMDRLPNEKETWPAGVPYKRNLMLNCEVRADGKRTSIPSKLDNTLAKYDSEYLFLFKQLYQARNKLKYSEDASADVIAQLALLPNLARRVLETFILFKFPDRATGSMINLYSAIKPLKVNLPPEKVSILDRLLNRLSHGSESSIDTINMLNLSETPKVIEYVLEFIEDADELHYSGLLKAIGAKETVNPTVVALTQPGEAEAATG